MPQIGIGFHTDAFNSSHKSFEQALAWAQENDVHYIEPGVIEGACWIHGLGYFPHISLLEDPALLRKKMERYGVEFSQIDAAYPLSGRDGLTVGVPYVQKAIAWAALAGSPRVATTDGLYKPEGLEDREALDLMKRSYGEIIRVAEAHEVVVTIEVHGYFTTKADWLAEMLAFCGDSPWLRLNLDTGNTFIAGNDPVQFADRFLDKIDHVHIKDVSQSLADSVRGGATGIAISHVAAGDGVNAENIRQILAKLSDNGFDGVLSIECEGQGGPMLADSLSWLRKEVAAAGFTERVPAFA
ncbi:sugar phosphate isomerase/epimerase family protein [Oerskovia enterophila]|uniref:Inosose dehydratase n=1 Tax=Oerskovia enterophila TaxID=43678 RepID=A0A163Q5R7_9CELL|nr:sugar phosphate isomerase/epimerase [Oerskovia enterophila]KZM33816.1 inosose dehydratase [Oerskovia enterophila]OCI33194.1 inosose dehydratase [Oerskovia enterophila]